MKQMGNTTDYIKEHLEMLSNLVTTSGNCVPFSSSANTFVFDCRPKSASLRTVTLSTLPSHIAYSLLRLFIYTCSIMSDVLSLLYL